MVSFKVVLKVAPPHMGATRTQRSAFFGSVLVLATVLGCGAGVGLAQPTSADVAIAEKRWPNRTLVELEQGRELYMERCAGCHALKRPEELPAEKWPEVVTEMNARPGPNLTDQERELVVAYLFSASTRLR
jgi:mono/diheme cytochrome c family protein